MNLDGRSIINDRGKTSGAVLKDIDLLAAAVVGGFFSLDVEGDGFGTHRPIEISLVEFRSGAPFGEYHWLVKPPGAISRYATAVHGLVADDLEGAPEIWDVAEEILEIVDGRVVVGHEIVSDITMIGQCIPEFVDAPAAFFDTRRLALALGARKTASSLDYLAAEFDPQNAGMGYGGCPVVSGVPRRDMGRHSSSRDAFMTGRLFVRLVADKLKSRHSPKLLGERAKFQVPETLRTRLAELRAAMGKPGERAFDVAP